MAKLVLIVCDALRDDAAAAQMGYLEHLVEQNIASRYTVVAQMPTMSRPNYETIHTGVPSSVHGITSNYEIRPSKMPNLFSLARGQNLTTAASAFYWYSELYNGTVPYDPVMHHEVDDETLNIQHGRFYGVPALHTVQPDVEVFSAGAMLARRFQPDYLLIHPMQADDIGETYGGDSVQYRRTVIAQDAIIANLLSRLQPAGYNVIVTSDHGMSDDPSTHGGSLPEVRHVPLYYIPTSGGGLGNTGQKVSQLQVAPTICNLLNIPIPNTMTAPPLEF
ncbi:MAG: alkaline phosphatase family protein [Anaerolineae bacterium]|nr:alkaline phosphatase family protein [Anaerolineae bacterium]